jgi:O-antigen/teichoic acid export membrane protein
VAATSPSVVAEDAPGVEGRVLGADLSVRGLLRRTSGLSSVSIVTAVLAVPTTLLAARWVGPARYGGAQYVLLFYFYAALLRTGVFEGGVREFIHESSVGDPAKGERARSVGFSWETLASAIPGLLMVPLGLLFGDPLRQIGFVLAPVAVLAASISAFFGGMFIAEQRLGVVGRTWLIRAIVLSTAVVAGVRLFGPVAIFVGPVVADATAVALFALARPRLRLGWVLDRRDGRRLLAAGFPLGLSAIVYWLYRMVGTTTVALSQTTRTLGVYAFALVPITVLTRSIAMAEGVLTPALWTAMASDVEEVRAWVGQAARITVSLAVVAGLATNLAQAAFGPVIAMVVPSFAQAVPLFEVLSLSAFPLAIAAVPALVLNSTSVNRQRTQLAILAGGLMMNIVANACVVLFGGGPIAVAWNDAWVQTVLLIVLFEAAAPHLDPGRSRFAVYAAIASLALWVLGVESVLHFALKGGGSSAVRLVERCGFVIAAWALILGVGVGCSQWRGRRRAHRLKRPTNL